MHILHLTHVLSFGGAQNILVGLAEEAVQRGHRVSVLTLCPGNDYGERLRAHDVAFRTLGYRGRFTPTSSLRLVRLRRSLVEAVRQIGPDIIHEQLFGPKILLYGKTSVAGIPIIQTQQDNSPWWRKDDVYSRLQTHVERVFTSKTAQYSVAVSESVQENLLAVTGLDPERCALVYNFTEMTAQEDTADSKRRRSGRSKIFMITRLNWEKKGLDVAIQIFRFLQKKRPDARLVIVGEGPDRARMEEEVRRAGLGKRVEFRGYRKNVKAQYKEADVVLMPSRWEGLSVTAIEAAAAGVPVVASRIGGLQEVVEHGQTGFTCDLGNIEGFAKCAIALLTDDVLYNRLSSNAVARARDRFSREKAFCAYEDLYHKMLNAPLATGKFHA